MSARPSIDDYFSDLLDATPPAPAPAPPTAAPLAAVADASPEQRIAPPAEAHVPTVPIAPRASAPADTGPSAPTAPVPVAAPPVLAPSAPAQWAAPALQADVLPEALKGSAAMLLSLQQRNEDERRGRRAAERSTRWLRMRCDEQHYAIELLKVQEVILPGALLPLRGAKPHMLGVMNLRGQIVPVIDLGLYLQRGPIIPDTCTRIVVLEEHGETLGLRVSAVEDVASITDHLIEPPSVTRVCAAPGDLFRGVARLGGRTLILLDASSLLE